jgi:hypothetical protein
MILKTQELQSKRYKTGKKREHQDMVQTKPLPGATGWPDTYHAVKATPPVTRKSKCVRLITCEQLIAFFFIVMYSAAQQTRHLLPFSS